MPGGSKPKVFKIRFVKEADDEEESTSKVSAPVAEQAPKVATHFVTGMQQVKQDVQVLSGDALKGQISELFGAQEISKAVQEQAQPLAEATELTQAEEPLNIENAEVDNSFEKEVEEFLKLKIEMKEDQELSSNMRDNILKYVEEVGQRDADDNKYLTIRVKDKSYIVMAQMRRSIKLDPAKAMQICNTKSLEECISYEPSLNEQAFEDAYKRGVITVEEVASATLKSESTALKITEARDE